MDSTSALARSLEEGDAPDSVRRPSRARLSLVPPCLVPPVPPSLEAPSGSPAAAHPARLASVTDVTELDELVRRAQRGDRVAFTELFRRHRNDVSRLVFRMLGPSADIEDVTQEVFLQVHKSLGEFRGQAKFTTWLHRVTVNVVLMARRSAKSRPVFTEEPAQDLTRDEGPWPDEDASRRERMRSFQRCIDLLPEKKRTVFVLHELEGLPAAEIAQIVEAPVLTVRTRLFYARKELADLMKKDPQLATFATEFERGSKSDDQGDEARTKQRAQ